jgi:hypothetical protein
MTTHYVTAPEIRAMSNKGGQVQQMKHFGSWQTLKWTHEPMLRAAK